MESATKLSGKALWPLAMVAIGAGHPATDGGPVHGTKAAAMGTAFTAVADDPAGLRVFSRFERGYGEEAAAANSR